MITLRYIGKHQPAGMLIEVEEAKVERYLDSGEYETLEKKLPKIVPKKEEITNVNSKRINSRF